MGQRKIVNDLKKFKKSVSRKIEVKEMSLYGSRARGDFLKYSDVDLIVVSEGFSKIPVLERAYQTAKLWKLNIPLEVFCYTPSEFELKKKESIYMQKILSEGIII